MTVHRSIGNQHSDFAKHNSRKGTVHNINIAQAQERLYEFLLEIVKNWPAEAVLQEFKRIYIHPTESVSSEIIPALYHLLFSNQETEFRNTLKRSCYILINNWEISRNYRAIQQLIEIFFDPILNKPTVSRTLKRLRSWLHNFVESEDFQELKLFAIRYGGQENSPWSYRYASYLLVSQYINLENPSEQRQAAKNLYVQLKEKFKFDLAMYTAYSSSIHHSQNRQNPTFLGDEVLALVQKVVAKRGFFSYANLAQIFLKQVQTIVYFKFKQSLLEYLVFSVAQNNISMLLKQQLSERLTLLYSYHDLTQLNDALLLRTVKKVIDGLTIANSEPASLFVFLLSKGHSLTLVMLLLKLVLICPYARTHLELRLAELIKYYEQYSEEECQWMIHFLEIFNITMAIHAENVEYSLVTMDWTEQQTNQPRTYRIFSQLKRDRISPFEVEGHSMENIRLEPSSAQDASV